MLGIAQFVIFGALGAIPAFAAPIPSVVSAARQHGPAIVTIHPLGGRGSSSLGFMVGTRGIAVTVSHLRPGEGVVLEWAAGERRRGRVISRQSKTALTVVEVVKAVQQQEPLRQEPWLQEPLLKETVALERNEIWPTLVLAENKTKVRKKDWLLGISLREDGSAVAALGGLHSRVAGGGWLIDLPCAAGTPILDRHGRVVAVATQSLGSHRVRAAPVFRLRALLETVR